MLDRPRPPVPPHLAGVTTPHPGPTPFVRRAVVEGVFWCGALDGVTVWYAGAEPDETSMLMPADGALVVELRAPGFAHVVFDDRVHGWEAVGEDRSHVPVGPLRQFGDGVFEVVCWAGYSSTDEQGADEFDAFGIFVRAKGGEWIELLQLELA